MEQGRQGLLSDVAPPLQESMDGGNEFELWEPSGLPADGSYKIVGSDFSQVLEVDVAPGKRVTAEPGTMVFMEDGLELDADVGGLAQGLGRSYFAGESMFRMHLINNTSTSRKLGISPRTPAKILTLDLAQHSGLIINRGAFLAASGEDWKLNVQLVGSLGAAGFGGQGLFMNTLHGTGTAFLNGGGTVVHKVLKPGETVIVNQHSVLAFERTVQFGVKRVDTVWACCCAGQGLFNATLTGPGFVLMHSMSDAKLAKAVNPAGGKKGARKKT